jgi:hypothetical protein
MRSAGLCTPCPQPEALQQSQPCIVEQHCHDPRDAVKGDEQTLDFRQHYGEPLTVLGADYVVECYVHRPARRIGARSRSGNPVLEAEPQAAVDEQRAADLLDAAAVVDDILAIGQILSGDEDLTIPKR